MADLTLMEITSVLRLFGHLEVMTGPTKMETTNILCLLRYLEVMPMSTLIEMTSILCLFRYLEVMRRPTLMETTSILCLLGHLEVKTGPTTSICAYYDTFTNNLVYFCLSVNDKEKQRFLNTCFEMVNSQYLKNKCVLLKDTSSTFNLLFWPFYAKSAGMFFAPKFDQLKTASLIVG